MVADGWSSLSFASSSEKLADPALLLTRRAGLFDRLVAQQTTLYRALHTTETGFYALDVAEEIGILSLYRELEPYQETKLATLLLESVTRYHPLQTIYLKRRPPEAKHLANVAREQLSPPEPLLGTSCEQRVALEEGISFLIRPAADLSIGLFTDARSLRAWVRANSSGRRVLNTFAYTCGFGLNAVLGGAEIVKNVDLSRKVLAWGRENYALNEQEAHEPDFLFGDVFEWLNRLARRGDAFDLVVLDPPSFARNKGKVWRSEKDYGKLVTLAAGVTARGGQLLCVLNHAGVSGRALQGQIETGLSVAGRRGWLTEALSSGEDYPGARHLKAQVWQLD